MQPPDRPLYRYRVKRWGRRRMRSVPRTGFGPVPAKARRWNKPPKPIKRR